jgi:hypothetical protein
MCHEPDPSEGPSLMCRIGCLVMCVCAYLVEELSEEEEHELAVVGGEEEGHAPLLLLQERRTHTHSATHHTHTSLPALKACLHLC